MERWLQRDMKPIMGPFSRSYIRPKVAAIASLLIRVEWESGNSFEEDAALLREISRLAQSAAHDLDPRNESS